MCSKLLILKISNLLTCGKYIKTKLPPIRVKSKKYIPVCSTLIIKFDTVGMLDQEKID